MPLNINNDKHVVLISKNYNPTINLLAAMRRRIAIFIFIINCIPLGVIIHRANRRGIRDF